jgi:hypothetical protein
VCTAESTVDFSEKFETFSEVMHLNHGSVTPDLYSSPFTIA